MNGAYCARRWQPRLALLAGNQGATARRAAAPHIIQKKGFSMTEFEEDQEHIQYTHNAFCRIVIRHASIDAARKLYSK